MTLYTDHPNEVEAIKRTLTFDGAQEAFWIAYRNVFLMPPSPEALACLLAHSALETGRWTVGLWCWNFGNKKASLSYPGKHCYFRCNELIDGEYQWFDPPHPQTRFRAFDSAAEGAEQQIRFLGTASRPPKPNRYARAWNCLLAGQPRPFVRELHKASYFTAHLEPYKNAVASLYNEFLPLCEAYKGPSLETPHDGDTPSHSAPSEADIQAAWIDLEFPSGEIDAERVRHNLEDL